MRVRESLRIPSSHMVAGYYEGMDIAELISVESGDHHTQDIMPRRLVEVAVNVTTPGTGRGVLTYAAPKTWTDTLVPGQLVWVPVRNRVELGLIVAAVTEEPRFAVRDLHAPVIPTFILAPGRMETAHWLARETASTLYASASPFLPPGVKNRAIDVLVPTGMLAEDASPPLTVMQRRLLELVQERGEITADAARQALSQALTTVIPALAERGFLRIEIRVEQHQPAQRMLRFVRLVNDDPAVVGRSAKQADVQAELIHLQRLRRDDDSDLIALAELRERVDADNATIMALVKKGVIEEVLVPANQAPQPRAAPAPALTPEQAAAWVVLERALVARDPTPNLLFGVTGSGKTELYLRGVAWCLRHGRSAIVLVPEIGLATQVVRRFIDRFPNQVAVVHSQMTDSRRLEVWQGIEAGEFRVVVGPRSALFAPLSDLGLIVLDEEHESTYKQDSEPRYHARTLALFLAEQAGAVPILGSATPSIESAWRADQGIYRRLILADRVSPHGRAERGNGNGILALPDVEIVDLKLELQQGNVSLLSRRLQTIVTDALGRQEQAILLLNRRGTSTVVLCRACGHRIICPDCDIPLVFHQDKRQMICHRCDYREDPPGKCPECGGRLDFFGAGTQRVEDEVRKTFPRARVLRWDQDSIRKQGGYEAMLHRVESGEVDLIVGTQMVAKGFDLPLVTAIGVIQADTILHLPDFRSSERTFQLLTQVAGRAGRRTSGSKVVVQTYTPDHYSVLAASRHDYQAFFDEEIDFREKHFYPPFVRLVRYVIRHENERKAAIEAEMMAREIAKHIRRVGVGADLLGPTPAFAAKVRGKFQWQVVLRSADLELMLDDLPSRPGWVVDVDPQSML